MIYGLLGGLIGVIFTLQLYCLSLFDKKPEPPIIERNGDMLITNLEARPVTVGNLDASVARIENIVAPPLIIPEEVAKYGIKLVNDTTFRRGLHEIFS